MRSTDYKKGQGVDINTNMLSVSRRELKYLISYEKSLELQDELGRLLRTDIYSQNGYYNVRSLYFDSFKNIDFSQKYDGTENRKKIRLRIYSSKQQNAKLELKEKRGAYQKKHSLIVDKDAALDIINGGYGRLLEYNDSDNTACRLYSLLTLGAYRPAAIVEYERRAFTYDEFNTRITFDRYVKSCECCYDIYRDDIPYIPVFSDYVILEVKFNTALIESVKNILGKYDLTNVSLGKYGSSRPLAARYIL